MTDMQIGLTVMSAVVVGVSLFGLFWLKVERARARKFERAASLEQAFFPFAKSAVISSRIEEATHSR